MQKMESVILQGELEGYRQSRAESERDQINESVAHNTVCLKDKVTMEYGMWVREGRLDREFAVCPKCDDCYEF